MPEKDIAQSLLKEAAKIVKDNQDPRTKDYALFVFGSLLDANKAGIPLDSNDTWALILRNECIGIIRTIKSLLSTDMSPLRLKSSGKEREKINILRKKIYSLKRLGITPYRYEEQDPEALLDNPLEVARYAASMLIATVNENVWYPDNSHDTILPILNPALKPVIDREVKHVDRFIGESMGTMTEAIPNH